MTSDSLITIGGSIITLLGTAITIWQTLQAKSYKDQIIIDTRKIKLNLVIESLKKAQHEIRDFPTSINQLPRGMKFNELIKKTREHFDAALGTLELSGPDGKTRELLGEAQKKLNSYEISYTEGNLAAKDVHDLQAKMQDVISNLSRMVFQLEKKHELE